jgi:transcriptional regulator with PAS, ATPase and Fis domain
MQEVYRLVERILHTTTTVLITGESGTGKELIARTIHSQGSRAKGPFIAVNCAAIPEALLEAELFGYERGAFTGAGQRKLGRFELAAQGTLFLDEIGEMNPTLQAKLLRVLQEKQIERVGGTQTIATDTRIIAATNRDLPQLLATGRFREDLFYRLNVYPIPLPPLRDREEDIIPLALYFLKKCGQELGKEGIGLSKEVGDLLSAHSWPGNIRELENVIERAVILCRGKVLSVQDLPRSLREQPPVQPARDETTRLLLRGMTLAALEEQCIRQALEQTNYNRLRASKLLGLSRTQLRTRMRKYGLEVRQDSFSYPDADLQGIFRQADRPGFFLQ